ncbi:hypothetical protein N2152v2_002920 [Parachlorella kessleri]
MQKTGGSCRVILHVDFDWEGLIAVNYAARDLGITRHMRVAEAKAKCPELTLVHVETIGGDVEAPGEGIDDAAPPAGAGAAAAGQGVPNRLTQKASLERYRRSTAEVLGLLHRLAPQAVIEKASIDEVYCDVTALVDRELQQQADGRVPPSPVDAFAWGSIVVGGPLDVGSEFERRLAKGAEIACRLRGALLSELGYTASAGIATNKLLAKVGAALHKPNQQTVIPPRAVQEVMLTLPLKKLKNFGGKLGGELQELGCSTAGEVQALPRPALVARFGEERAAWIEQAVRGVSHEAVEERERPKSMLAAKTINPTSDLAALQRWFQVLAEELASRMATDEAQYRRRPRNLIVHYRTGETMGYQPGESGVDRSKSCPMPRFGPEGPSATVIAQAGFALFKARCLQEALPCTRLALSAGEFSNLPSSNSAITRFLVPQQQAQAAQSARESDAVPSLAAGATPGAHVPVDERSRQATGHEPALHGQRSEHKPAQQQQQQQRRQQQQRPAPDIADLFHKARKRQRLEADHGQAAIPGDVPAEQSHREELEQPGLPLQQAQARQPVGTTMAEATPYGGGSSLQAGSAAVGQQASAPAWQRESVNQQHADTSLREPGVAHADGSSSPAQQVDAAAEASHDSGQPVLCEAPKQDAADEAADPLLADIDLTEQARILKEIELRKVLGTGGSKAGQAQRAGGRSGQQHRKAAGDKKQQGIAAFFNSGR